MKIEKSFLTLLSLCLQSRCPVCSRGALFLPLTKISSFHQIFLPPKACSRCRFQFCREAGYYFGVMMPLLPIFSLATALVFIGAFVLAFHPDSVFQLILPGVLGAVIGLIVFFRPAIAIFISLDHALDPPDYPGW